MRKLTAFAAAAVLMTAVPLCLPAASLAEEDRLCTTSAAGEYFCVVNGVIVRQERRPGVAPVSSDGNGGTGITYVPYQVISTDYAGNPCIQTRYVQEASDIPRPVAGTTDTEQSPGGVSSLYDTAPACPQQPVGTPGVLAADTALTIALREWARIPLPSPHPRIQPGRAITGKPGYLETQGTTGYQYAKDTALGTLNIVATGRHYVDWGDGEQSGPFATNGAAWPDGTIHHEYINVGAFDIVVTTRWTATWRIGGEGGTLPPTQTTGRLDDFPVQQIQAVIVR